MAWRRIRSAIEAAYEKLGFEKEPNGFPRRDWNLVEASIEAYEQNSRRKCCGCGELIPYRQEITCLDCKAPLHEVCAPRHFWPNGRPKK